MIDPLRVLLEVRLVAAALRRLGASRFTDVRIGKHLELDVDAEGDALADTVDRLCADFLTNPVIESYTWRVITEDERADAERA